MAIKNGNLGNSKEFGLHTAKMYRRLLSFQQVRQWKQAMPFKDRLEMLFSAGASLGQMRELLDQWEAWQVAAEFDEVTAVEVTDELWQTIHS